nr:adenosylcobinamide-GDP ribazoletransferase [Thiomicrorhabdus marina]
MQFFSRLPLAITVYSTIRQTQILNYLPLVGLIFGFLMVGIFALVIQFINLFIASGIAWWQQLGVNEFAFLVLLVSVWLSGALHLDGVADSADAALGSINQPEKALQIMHDSRIGTGAAVALTMLLLGKWLFLSAIFVKLFSPLDDTLFMQGLVMLMLIPFLARLMPLCLSQGAVIASQTESHRNMFTAVKSSTLLTYVVFFSSLVLLAFLVSQSLFTVVFAALALLSLAVLALWLRSFANKLLGGINGDIAGLSIELSELLLLFVLLMVLRVF